MWQKFPFLRSITNFCAPSRKSPAHIIQQKICHSISPTKCKQNLYAKICQTLFSVHRLPNFVPKKASHPVSAKKPNVGEIDPCRQFHRIFCTNFLTKPLSPNVSKCKKAECWWNRPLPSISSNFLYKFFDKAIKPKRK